jgi:two-component system, OmpR family, phosphate regulon sensor histidine kinase PhoR
MSSKTYYPWFYFKPLARLSFIIFALTLLVLMYIYHSLHQESLISQARILAHFEVIEVDGKILCRPKDAKAHPHQCPLDNQSHFEQMMIRKTLPIALMSYVIFLFFFYHLSAPLGKIIAKIKSFNISIPFDRNLELMYKKDDWANIEEVLRVADDKIKVQMNQIKAENEKISAILESIYDKIIAIDSFETILFYNTKFKSTFMQSERQELVPKIWHVFSNPELLEGFRSVLSSGPTLSLKSLQFKNSLKPDHYFDLTITPLRSPEGVITGALGVFYDVTEFKRSEQMRVDFVANVSHEIRTPLTSIKGYTQVLESQRSQIPIPLHPFLDKILNNTDRMISLFNDLLNLSVIESKYKMQLDSMELYPLIDEVLSNMQANYPGKKIQLDLDLELPTIKADQRLMEQVLSNLMDNACKYSTNDIFISIKSWTENGLHYLSISDQGPGISPQHLERIFERFYRVDSSREVSRGTGLGLSIVKHIITRHSGRIWAQANSPCGTSFIIQLPPG